jgi:hypothetical protein
MPLAQFVLVQVQYEVRTHPICPIKYYQILSGPIYRAGETVKPPAGGSSDKCTAQLFFRK